MKRYHINKTLIREDVHKKDLKISEGSLEKFERLVAQAVEKACSVTAGSKRKIVKAADQQGIIPHVQVTFGPGRSGPEPRSMKKRKFGGDYGRRKEETYITA